MGKHFQIAFYMAITFVMLHLVFVSTHCFKPLHCSRNHSVVVETPLCSEGDFLYQQCIKEYIRNYKLIQLLFLEKQRLHLQPEGRSFDAEEVDNIYLR
jgi:hypothetical protein